MNEQDTLALLIYCNELDGRISPNEIKVQAWADVFNESAREMPFNFAQKVAKKHYSIVDVLITPNTFVKAWSDHRRFRTELQMTDAAEVSERHCKQVGCMCTHSGACFKGWIDIDSQTTAPCRVCRASLATVLDEIPPLGMRQDHDMARIRNRGKT